MVLHRPVELAPVFGSYPRLFACVLKSSRRELMLPATRRAQLEIQNKLVEEDSHGTYHREAASELRRGQDDPASAYSGPGASSNGGLCHERGARSRRR